MWTKIKNIAILIACLTACVYIAHTINLAAEKKQLEQELAISQATSAMLSNSLAFNISALTNREITVSQLTEDKQNLLGELDELYSLDREARTWAATIIPNNVLTRLR